MGNKYISSVICVAVFLGNRLEFAHRSQCWCESAPQAPITKGHRLVASTEMHSLKVLRPEVQDQGNMGLISPEASFLTLPLGACIVGVPSSSYKKPSHWITILLLGFHLTFMAFQTTLSPNIDTLGGRASHKNFGVHCSVYNSVKRLVVC